MSDTEDEKPEEKSEDLFLSSEVPAEQDSKEEGIDPNFADECGCKQQRLARMTPENARALLLNKGQLLNVEVEELDLSGCDIEHKVEIEGCRIGRFNTTNSTWKQSFRMKKTTITGECTLSRRDSKEEVFSSTFLNDVRIEKCEFLGNFECTQAHFQGEMMCFSKFADDAFWQECNFDANVGFNDSNFENQFHISKNHFHGSFWMGSVVMKGRSYFRKNNFYKKVNVKFSRFEGRTHFNDSVFHLRAGFNRIVSCDQIEFNRTVFMDEFSSRGAEYKGTTSFRECRVEKSIHIPNSKFVGRVAFNLLKLQGIFDAAGSTFHSKFNMDKVDIVGEVDFHKTLFEGGFFCRNSSFSGQYRLKFSKAKFQKEADWDNSSLRSTLDFTEAQFLGKLTFKGAILGAEGEVVNFRDTHFGHRAQFERATFACQAIFNGARFTRRSSFERSNFLALASFSDTKFNEFISFSNAHFAKSSFFHRCKFPEANFIDTEFEGGVSFSIEKHLIVDDDGASIFEGSANFTNTRFLKKAIFQSIKFQDDVKFSNAYFGEQVSFLKSCFAKNLTFSGTFCSLELDLREIQVNEELSLRGANINRRLNLADSEFGKISFYNLETDSMVVTPEQLEGKMRGSKDAKEVSRNAQEYLVLKRSFGFRGMQEQEDWAYWQFRRASRVASSLKAREDKKYMRVLRNGLERVFIDYGSHYGTHPLRITMLAGFLIAAFGVFYWFFPDQLILEGSEITDPNTKASLGQCIYFSIMAFTTMGFGDVHPDFFGWMKGVVALEALVGIITMTLFVGTYARKIVR